MPEGAGREGGGFAENPARTQSITFAPSVRGFMLFTQHAMLCGPPFLNFL